MSEQTNEPTSKSNGHGEAVIARLTDLDRRSLQAAHIEQQIAALQAQLAALRWETECERIGAVYRINPMEQALNINTGEITRKVEETQPCL